MSMLVLVFVVMTVELGLHYFPWRMLLRGRELPRLAAYTLGSLGMMGPFTVWLWLIGEYEVIQTLWMVICAAGLMVFALYGLDHYLDLIMKDVEATERENVHAKEG